MPARREMSTLSESKMSSTSGRRTPMTTENVAILFTDIVGSTELSQRLSPEVADEVWLAAVQVAPDPLDQGFILALAGSLNLGGVYVQDMNGKDGWNEALAAVSRDDGFRFSVRAVGLMWRCTRRCESADPRCRTIPRQQQRNHDVDTYPSDCRGARRSRNNHPAPRPLTPAGPTSMPIFEAMSSIDPLQSPERHLWRMTWRECAPAHPRYTWRSVRVASSWITLHSTPLGPSFNA
jgi:hypothetical protein